MCRVREGIGGYSSTTTTGASYQLGSSANELPTGGPKMPYYQRHGQVPPKRHTMHRVSPDTRARVFITRKSSPLRASAGVQHCLPHQAADTGQGSQGRRSCQTGHRPRSSAPAHSHEDRPHADQARSSHRPRADLCKCRRHHVALPACRVAEGTLIAMRPPTRSFSFIVAAAGFSPCSANCRCGHSITS